MFLGRSPGQRHSHYGVCSRSYRNCDSREAASLRNVIKDRPQKNTGMKREIVDSYVGQDEEITVNWSCSAGGS
jgi:hypothetical protein